MKYYLEKGWSTHNRHLPPGFGVAPVGQSKKAQPLPVQAQITPERNWRTEYRNLPPKFGIAAGAIPGGPRRRVAARTARGLGGYDSGFGYDVFGYDIRQLQEWGKDRIYAIFPKEIADMIMQKLEELDRERDAALKLQAAQAISSALQSPRPTSQPGSLSSQLTSAVSDVGLMATRQQLADAFKKYRTPIMVGVGVVGLLLSIRLVRGIASPYSKK